MKCHYCYSSAHQMISENMCVVCRDLMARGMCPRGHPKDHFYCGITNCPVHGNKAKKLWRYLTPASEPIKHEWDLKRYTPQDVALQAQAEIDDLERMWKL